MQSFTLERTHDCWTARFRAMASPCELLINADDRKTAQRLGELASEETWRIERKFSRYRTDNILHTINSSPGIPVEVDSETANMLDYAQTCYEISDGLFDITSGILRRIWKFDGSNNVPRQKEVEEVLRFIGWHKVTWSRPFIILPENMEIDLGGIGKEYAVDRCIELIKNRTQTACLVNFGGDIRVTGPRKRDTPWIIGVEDPQNESRQKPGSPSLHLKSGALATSGDSKKFLIKEGVRYGHIINPKSGWPPVDAPRSVTVVSDTCTEAGILSTLAILSGKNADSFLKDQCINFWCEW